MSRRFTTITSGCSEFIEDVPAVTIVKNGWIRTNLNGPKSMAFDGTFVYVTNSDNNTIIKTIGAKLPFNPLPDQVSVWIGPNSVIRANLNRPHGIAIDGNNMYIVNAGSNSIIKIENFNDQNNVHVINWIGPVSSGYSIGTPYLNNPREIVIKNNNMYITNWGSGSLVKIPDFNNPDPYNVNPLLLLGNTGSGAFIQTQTTRLHGLAIDNRNDIYVSDPVRRNIIKILNESTAVSFFSFSSLNSDPYGLALDDNNSLYVVVGSSIYKIQNTSNHYIYAGKEPSRVKNVSLSSPINVYNYNSDMYIVCTGNTNSIEKIMNFQLTV